MWTSFSLVLATLASVSHGSNLTPRNDINITAFTALPQCAKDCGTRVLAAFQCLPTDPCFCLTEGPQVDALSACLAKSCTLEGALASQKFQAETCGFPFRDKGPKIAATSYALFGVATVFVLARFVSRTRRLYGAGFGADDWIVAFAYLSMVGMTVVAYFEDHYGSGRDVWTVPVSNLGPFALWFYIGQPFYVVVTYLTKLSLVFLYLRIWHEEHMSSFRITCWIVATSLIMCTIGCVLACILPCQPISYAWRQVLPSVTGTCSNRVAAAYAFSGINIAYDVVVLLIPIPRFIGLKMSVYKKIGLCACFLAGFAVTAISIIRLTHLSSLNNSRNPTWDFAAPGFWSLIEVYCSMICCCTPAMAGFLHRLYTEVLHRPLSYFRGSITSVRSDSQLMQSRHESAGQFLGEGEIYIDEKGRVRGRNTSDVVHVEKAARGGIDEQARIPSLDGRERPKEVARFRSEANVVQTVLQEPRPVIIRLSDEEEQEVIFAARQRGSLRKSSEVHRV